MPMMMLEKAESPPVVSSEEQNELIAAPVMAAEARLSKSAFQIHLKNRRDLVELSRLEPQSWRLKLLPPP